MRLRGCILSLDAKPEVGVVAKIGPGFMAYIADAGHLFHEVPYGVGVSTVNSYAVKRIDSEFFSEEEEPLGLLAKGAK